MNTFIGIWTEMSRCSGQLLMSITQFNRTVFPASETSRPMSLCSPNSPGIFRIHLGRVVSLPVSSSSLEAQPSAPFRWGLCTAARRVSTETTHRHCSLRIREYHPISSALFSRDFVVPSSQA